MFARRREFMTTTAMSDDERGYAMANRRREMREKSEKDFSAIIQLAGFTVERIWELANRYWPDHSNYDDVRSPWWLFLTNEVGPIQIGWRKNVIHIEWDACDVRAVVTEDDVTKGPTYVHAWSTEKAVEYLKVLRSRAAPRRLT
jgi:hypothetical protein